MLISFLGLSALFYRGCNLLNCVYSMWVIFFAFSLELFRVLLHIRDNAAFMDLQRDRIMLFEVRSDWSIDAGHVRIPSHFVLRSDSKLLLLCILFFIVVLKAEVFEVFIAYRYRSIVSALLNELDKWIFFIFSCKSMQFYFWLCLTFPYQFLNCAFCSWYGGALFTIV